MNPYLLPALIFLTSCVFSALVGLLFRSNSTTLILTRLFLLLVGVVGALLVYWLWSRNRSANSASPSAHEISDLDSIIQSAAQQLQNAQRNSSPSLSRLPLLYVLGAPNSGKTTTISRSGMDPELLAGHVYQYGAVVPTQRLNIWYAAEAVFLDAGDTLTRTDSLWDVLVRRTSPGTIFSLLGTHRPVRSAIVCISSESFLGPDASKTILTLGRKTNLTLRQIARQLGVDLPVHVILTKLDRIPGFTDFVQHLTQQEVAETLGITFPGDSLPVNLYGERASTLISDSLNQLIFSLGEFRLELLGRNGNTSSTPAIYQFPRELQKLRSNLTTYLIELTRPTHLNANPSLRSFSCVGVRAEVLDQAVVTPAEMHRAASVDADVTGIFSRRQIHEVQSPFRPGTIQRIARWCFLPQLYPQVLLAKMQEVVPASASRRVVLVRRSACAVLSILLAVWAIGLTVSYSRNAALQRNIREAAASLVPLGPPVDFASESQLASLDRLRAAINQLERFEHTGAPLSYRWGLYRGHALIAPTRALYLERFRWLLLSATQDKIQRYLGALPSSAPADADYLSAYNPLRAYLITTSFPQYSSGEFLEPVLTSAWLAGRHPQSDSQDHLARQQFNFYGNELRNASIYEVPSPLPPVLHARTYLNSFGSLDRVYQNMLAAANRASNPIDFNHTFPGSAATVVETHVVPGAFSTTGYAFMEKALQNPERYFTGEPWVLGDQLALNTQSGTVSQKLNERYTADYSSQWQTFLRSATVVRFRTTSEAAQKLGSLSSPDSALLALVFTASRNTSISNPVIAHRFQPTQALVPSTLSNRLIAPSNNGYINSLIGLQGSLSQFVQSTDPASNPTAVQSVIAASTAAHGAVSQTAQAFDVDPSAHVEQMVIKLLQEPITSVEESVRGAAPAQVNNAGRQFCTAVASTLTKYPFHRSAVTEATPAEVAAILQPGTGSLWQFYETALKTLVIQQGTQWAAAPTATVKPTAQFLQFFNHLAVISGALFPHGESTPTLQLNAHVLRSPGIQSVTFDLDGQKLSGADVTKQFKLTMQAAQEAQLLATYGGNNLPLQFTGNWAVFRLVDRGHIEQPSGPLRLAYPLEISGTPIVVNGLPLTERLEFSGPGANALAPGARSELQCVSQVAH